MSKVLHHSSGPRSQHSNPTNAEMSRGDRPTCGRGQTDVEATLRPVPENHCLNPITIGLNEDGTRGSEGLCGWHWADQSRSSSLLLRATFDGLSAQTIITNSS